MIKRYKKENIMRCYICNTPLSEVQFNSDHKDIDPCPTCLLVIAEANAGFLDKPSADEDAFEEDTPVFLLSDVWEGDDE